MVLRSHWGEITVCDAHVHFFSHRFFSVLAGQKKLAGPDPVAEAGRILGWEMPPAEPRELAVRWAAELDRHGVSRACLIASIPGDERSVAAAVDAFPGRFFGFFFFDPTEPDPAGRLASAFSSGRLRGICLFPAMHRYSLHDERVRPVFEAAALHGAIVFVHCGVLSVGARQKLGLESRFDMRFSNPIDLHAIALAYPGVRFVVPHFGAGYFREVLMLADLCPNVFLDTSSSNSWMRLQPEELSLRQVFRRALDVAGPGRLLFGSDSSFFPRGWHARIFEQQADALYEIGVSAADARRILGGNLLELLDAHPADPAGAGTGIHGADNG
jgi:uncharacterized protein